eukprot:TRINITY_DN2542_c0_g1_i15.p1 TRINITY_DN2542_c0_g1~~TRINITY_DN2542_c0_g1_i15.p1  ORF type:complete len:120 (+),score=19.21 TRINITY_DN2542_c0_g1_i15:631-990(+)
MDNFLIFYPEHSSLKLPKGRSKSGYQSRANHGFVNDLDAKPGADNDNGNSSMSSLNHRSPSIALFSFTARFSHPKIVDNHNLQFMATSLSPQKTRSCSTAAIDWRYLTEQLSSSTLFFP